MTPNPAKPDKSANKPSPITTTPADLKKSGAYLLSAKDAEPNDRSASIGKVPKANASMIINPATNDPLESDAICIA